MPETRWRIVVTWSEQVINNLQYVKLGDYLDADAIKDSRFSGGRPLDPFLYSFIFAGNFLSCQKTNNPGKECNSHHKEMQRN